jgi:exopolyphosphatase / guanosine-5'-triphosphate,3'-diphosphate pyrophosphatase
VVRYHNRKSEPAEHHPAYSSLNSNDKRIARRLGSLVRIAEGLDHSHRQRILGLRASFQRGGVTLHVDANGDVTEDLRDAERSSNLFEKEFHVQLFFRRPAAD